MYHCAYLTQYNLLTVDMINNNLRAFKAQLKDNSLRAWTEALTSDVEKRLRPDSQRNFPAWLNALAAIPVFDDNVVDLNTDTITTRHGSESEDPAIRQALQQLKPWRKGPFQLNGTAIDTEWRCDWKWQRIAPHIDLTGLNVLDVGCGNGYYSLRMLGASAASVIGLDTSLLYWSQFQAVTRFTNEHRATVLPLGVECLESTPHQFDALFSMGVLYHRRQPLEHLMLLHKNLVQQGKLVLETLILHGHEADELIPENRYANMRNVWSVPTLPLLLSQLQQAGFCNTRCIDINRTTVSEQRPTEWMTFNSLVDALDDSDQNLTREGHPGPIRAVVIAEKATL